MLELIVFPKRAERKPWELFFIGLLYSSLAYLLVKWIFAKDVVLSMSSGILIVMFASLFSIIFFFYALRLDEKENIEDKSDDRAMKEDWKILKMFLWLFLGFLVGFAFWQIVIPGGIEFNSQMQTYCVINKPFQYQDCLTDLNKTLSNVDMNSVKPGNIVGIISNNIVVLISLLLFALIFGAGVIFIIAWNASIIASVIAFSAKYSFIGLPLSMIRFMLHGILEIAAYFIIVMAGGMASFALTSFIKNKLTKESLMRVVRRAVYLILLGLIIIVLAGFVEVYITPLI
jgi:uncharacterized membrane protein SpoIIM required for sporulation